VADRITTFRVTSLEKAWQRTATGYPANPTCA